MVAEHISVEPLEGLTFGATIRGISIAEMNDKGWQKVEEAFHKYGTLVIPDQHGLSIEAQKAFAKRFGELEIEELPITNVRDGRVLSEEEVEKTTFLRVNENWHMDSTYMPVQAKCGMLFAEKVPASGGGETEIADMRAAYDALDYSMREKLDSLKAYHAVAYTYARFADRFPLEQDGRHGTMNDGDDNPYANYGKDPNLAFLRPMVKVHPVTGRKNIHYASHIFGIDGMPREEAKAFLDTLRDAACQHPRTYAHKWKPGDFLLWDNRCCLHRARPYDPKETRVLRGSRVSGDKETESGLPAPDAPKLLAAELSILKQEFNKRKAQAEAETPTRSKL